MIGAVWEMHSHNSYTKFGPQSFILAPYNDNDIDTNNNDTIYGGC